MGKLTRFMHGFTGLKVLTVVVLLCAIAAELTLGDVLWSSKGNLTPLARILIFIVGTSVLAALGLRSIERSIRKTDATDESSAHPASRFQSVAPLLRGVLLILIVVTSFLTILAELGVNIGPMLAGAGIFGLTLGLGLQSLVRDIFSGIFYMIDDAFRIGEYVDFGEKKGVVEKILLRSVQIRHHRGAIHTVPYSQISAVTNLSRDWIITKLEVTIRHDADLRKVREIVRTISREISEDPELSSELVEPVKLQGIDQISDLGLSLRIKFRSSPGQQQFAIRRQIFARMTEEFSKAGIPFARRSMTLLPEEDADQTARTGAAGS